MKGTLISNTTPLPYTLYNKDWGLEVTLVGEYNIPLGKETSGYFWTQEAEHATYEGDVAVLQNDKYQSHVELFVKGDRKFYRIVSVEVATGKGVHTSYFY